MSDESILHRLEAQGHESPQIRLRGAPPTSSASGRYEVGEEFARGGVGAIHRGRDNDVGRDVALKVLHAEHMGKPEFVQRFVEEAQIGGQLQHPGIVPVYELGLREDDRPFFAMKLVKGETLAARLARRAAPTDDLRRLLGVFRDLCRTMSYAHARGVVHRDLKPANVMIGSFGEVQVVDWGLGKVLRAGGIDDELLQQRAHDARTMISTVRSGGSDGDSVVGSVMGTPAYMPPEQALGQVDSLDESSDVFSLCAILCEILTGLPPYEGSPGECLVQARRGDLQAADARLSACGADEHLVEICRQGLAPLPQDRPQGADVLADVVAEHLAAAEGRAHRAELEALEARVQADAQAGARRQTRLLALGGLAVVLVAVASWLLLDRGARERERERRGAIQAAVQEAERLRAAGQYDQALAAATRAHDLGDTSGLATVVAGEAEAVAADTAERAEHEALHVLLEDLRGRWGLSTVPGRELPSGGELGRPARQARLVDAAYGEAFGYALGDGTLALERLGGASHAGAMAESVAHWGWLRRLTPGLPTAETTDLDALCDGLDPDNATLRRAFRGLSADERVAWLGTLEAPLPAAVVPEVALVLKHYGHLEDARALLLEAHAQHPDRIWVHLGLTDVAEQLGESERAVDHATAALTIEPRFLGALLRLARAQLHVGALEEAALVYERALQVDPEHAPAHLGLGVVRLEQGRSEDALAQFERARELDPESAVAYRNIGRTREAGHDRAGAAAAYREAASLDPEYARAHDDLGRMLLRSHDLDGAVAAFRRGLAAAPRDMHLNMHLADALVQARAFDAAVVAARDAVQAAPADASAHAALGHALMAQDEVLAAKASFQRAIELDGRCAEARRGMGRVHRFRRRYRAARAALEKAVEADPRNLRAYEWLGRVLSRDLGETAAALARLEAAVEIDPSFAPARAEKARALAWAGRGPEAIETAQRAVDVDPKSAFAWASLAYVQIVVRGLAGRAEAVAALRKAHLLDPDSAVYLRDTATNLRLLGRLEVAQEAIEKALELEPNDYRNQAEAWEIARWMRWKPKLAAISRGEIVARSSVDLQAIARLYQVVDGDMEAAVRMSRAAVPMGLRSGYVMGGPRYEAARAAVLAGAAHHDEALGWLRERLAKMRDDNMPSRPHGVYDALLRWKRLSDFSAVRDGPDVSPVWKAFWADVDALYEEARRNIP